MRRDPFEEMRDLLDRMGGQFGARSPAERESGGSASAFGTVSVDVTERDDEYVVTADLPGFDTDDIDLSVRDETLGIEARREESTEAERGEEESGRVVRKERSASSVRRRLGLPGPVDEADATAEYRNGVLTVTLPKADDAGGYSIDVE